MSVAATALSIMSSRSSTPSPTLSHSSRSDSIGSLSPPKTPPNLHQNSIDPAAPWLVQKYGGTSVGKFARTIARDIVPYVSSSSARPPYNCNAFEACELQLVAVSLSEPRRAREKIKERQTNRENRKIQRRTVLVVADVVDGVYECGRALADVTGTCLLSGAETGG